MQFILQGDDVSILETRAVRHAAAVVDQPIQLARATLASVRDGSAVGVGGDGLVDACPVGSVEFVAAWADLVGATLPAHMTYPECLRRYEFMRRELREGRFSDAVWLEFVKPRHRVKEFTGALVYDLEPGEQIAAETEVWISEPVVFRSEWRFYILAGRIVGAGRYDDGEEDAIEPHLAIVELAVEEMKAAGEAPEGYALDFGVLDDGRTALVEANDGWALGYYKGTCSQRDYASLLWSRWVEIRRAGGGQRSDV